MEYTWFQLNFWIITAALAALIALHFRMYAAARKRISQLHRQIDQNIKEKQSLQSIHQSLFATSKSGILIYENNRLIDVNSAALEIYRKPKEYFEQHHPATCSPTFQPNGEKSEELAEAIMAKVENGSYQQFEWVHTRDNNQHFDADIAIFPFESGSAKLHTVIVRDISERKIMERELHHIKSNLENIVFQQNKDLLVVNAKLNAKNQELAHANKGLQDATASLKIEIAQREVIQRKQEESQQILSRFIEQSPVGISIIQTDGHVLTWNPEMVKMTGISERQATASFAWELNAQMTESPNKHAELQREMEKYVSNLHNAKEQKAEEQYLRADKSTGYLERITFPIIINDKQLLGLICRDLTQQKLLEAKQEQYNKQIEQLILAQSEKNIDLFQKLTAIFSNSYLHIAFFTITSNDIILSVCNAEWAKMMNAENNPPKEKSIREIYSASDVEVIATLLNKVQQNNDKFTDVIEWKTPKGLRYFDLSIIPIRAERSEPIVQVVCFYQDITEKRKMEKALMEREAHLARAQELSHMGSWKLNIKTGEMQVSKEIYQIFELNPEPHPQFPEAIYAATHPDDYNRVLEYVKFSYKNVNTGSIEHRIKLPNGKIKYLQVQNNTLSNNEGHPVLIEGTTQDITEQKLMEQSLRESEEKFRKIFDNSIDTISLIDCETNTYYDVNKQFLKTIGLKKEDVIGKSRDEIQVWANPVERKNYTEQLNSTGRVLNFYMHWNVLAGQRYYLLSTEKISINHKQYYLTISTDIDEQQQMAQALAESEIKFRNIFNAATDGILLTSDKFTFQDCSPSLCSMLGYSKSELFNTNIKQFVPPSLHPLLKERARQIRQGRSITIEIPTIHKNGTLVPIEVNSKLLHVGDKNIVLTQIRDLSERKKMEEKLVTSTIEAEENERRKLAQDLHDDVGPLLSSMNMYISLLARKPEVKPHEAIVKDIERILKETITTVREISNKISPHILVNYGLVAALNNFFRYNERLLPVNFSNNLNEERLPSLTELMLFRIIKEAYNNTVKHAEATQVSLIISKKSNKIEVEYQDNGNGFDMEQQPTNKIGGLGLHTIQSRLTTIGGQFVIRTAPGKGFYMYISLAFA